MKKNNKYFYSSFYFIKTSKILKKIKKKDIVTMQFFQMNNNIKLFGINECIKIIKKKSIKFNSLIIHSLSDGDIINSKEPVLKITGNYYKFGYLENIIDGILSRQSSIATNCYNITKIINSNKIIYMNDRSDYYYNQENDGYAAYKGGNIRFFSTYAHIKKIKDKTIFPIGTMPHSLIQSFGGDLIKSLYYYKKFFPNDKLVALVDYNNDVINDSLLVARKFKNKLYAVRIDTSENLIDKYFENKLNKFSNNQIKGVNKYLILALRNALDKENFKNIKIIVSSGFDLEKITEFENEKIPVDFYGVGKYFSKINIRFIGDCVLLNNIEISKFGRKNIFSKRLIKLK